jgi:hypothetical protein
MEECQTVGYNKEAFQHNISDVIVLKGYWIWWCKKHNQPLAWCEKDKLKEEIAMLKQKLVCVEESLNKCMDAIKYDSGH